MLSRQTRQAAGDVAWLIRQAGSTALVTRPTPAGTGTFFGAHESGETAVGEISVEVNDVAPKDLAELGCDAVASVLPDSGVQENDFMAVAGVRYRVSEVKPQNLFGTVTHLDLHLVMERRHG
jgi:hypothetical protein